MTSETEENISGLLWKKNKGSEDDFTVFTGLLWITE